MRAKNLFGLLAIPLLTGCAQLCLENKIGTEKPYSSEVIKQEYGFKEIDGNNLIDEADYPKIKDDTLFIVGYSRVFSTERGAREDAERNARLKILESYGGNGASKKMYIKNAYASKFEVHNLINQEGKQCYAMHCLMEAPLSGIKKTDNQR